MCGRQQTIRKEDSVEGTLISIAGSYDASTNKFSYVFTWVYNSSPTSVHITGFETVGPPDDLIAAFNATFGELTPPVFD